MRRGAPTKGNGPARSWVRGRSVRNTISEEFPRCASLGRSMRLSGYQLPNKEDAPTRGGGSGLWLVPMEEPKVSEGKPTSHQ